MPSIGYTSHVICAIAYVMLWLIEAGTLPMCQEERAAWKLDKITTETSWNPFASSAHFGAHHRAYLECVYPIECVKITAGFVTLACSVYQNPGVAGFVAVVVVGFLAGSGNATVP